MAQVRKLKPKPNETAAKPVARRSQVQSAATAVSVLKALAAMGGAGTLSALAARLDASPAKVHRYLASLAEADLVRQDEATARYALGHEAIAIGLAAIRQSDALTLAAGELARLAESENLSCFVAVLGNRGPTIVRWFESRQPVTVNVKVGSVMPFLWSATGRAYAAFTHDAGVQASIEAELAAATPQQRMLLPDRAAVHVLVADIRRTRCAPVRDLLLVGVSAVAAPVFDAERRLAAVVTGLGPTGSFDPAPDGVPATRLMGAADAVSRRLGWDGLLTVK